MVVAIVVFVFSQIGSIGTDGIAAAASASVEIVVGLVATVIVRTVYFLQRHLREPGAHLQGEHQASHRLQSSPHPCRISIAFVIRW